MAMVNPYAPPVAVVRDVRDPLAATEAAGRGIRLGATVLDGLIIFAMVYLPLMPVFVMSTLSNTPGDGAVGLMFGSLGLAFIGFVVWCWFTIKYVNANGQSIGKKLCGIKVLRSDGSPASLGRIFWMRNVINSLLGIIPLYGLIDPMLIFGEARQCIHDKIADTIVVVA